MHWDMEIGISYVYGYGPFLIQCRQITGCRSPVFFRTRNPLNGSLVQQGIHGLLENLAAVTGVEHDAVMGELRSILKVYTHPFLDCVGDPTGTQQASPLRGKTCQASPHINVGLLLEHGLLQKTCEGGTHWDVDGLPSRTLHESVLHVSCVMVLWMVGWLVDPRRSNTEVLACCVLTFGIFLATWDVIASLVIFWKVTEDPDILSACLMLRTRCWSTLGFGPMTCDPSNGAVRTTLRTCGWKPKFFSKASLLSSCRLDAAANPEDMAATCASWITASFSLSNLVPPSLGDSSEITDVTMESGRDAYMAVLLASSSVSTAIFWDIWKLAGSFHSLNPSMLGGLVWYNASLCIFSLYGSRGKTSFTGKCLNVELPAFSISESVVLSTSSSSLSPCAILAVDAIMSNKDGWSIQETLSVFSSSPRSNRDALAALCPCWHDLEGTFRRSDRLSEQWILCRTSLIFSIGNTKRLFRIIRL